MLGDTTFLICAVLVVYLYVRSVFCPAISGFTYNIGSRTCFKLVTQAANWSIASHLCHALYQRAHLVVVNDDTKHAAVRSYLQGTRS